MFGPKIRFPNDTRLELLGTPIWVPAMLLAIIAFSMGLAWAFFQAEHLWHEVAMGRMLRHATSTGRYVVSWPIALMTLSLGLPWMLALSQVRLRTVTLDATEGVVSVWPLGSIKGFERRVPFSEITGIDIARMRAPLLRRLIGRPGVGTRPVLHLASGKSLPLVSRSVGRPQSEKILHMALKVLPPEVSEGR